MCSGRRGEARELLPPSPSGWYLQKQPHLPDGSSFHVINPSRILIPTGDFSPSFLFLSSLALSLWPRVMEWTFLVVVNFWVTSLFPLWLFSSFVTSIKKFPALKFSCLKSSEEIFFFYWTLIDFVTFLTIFINTLYSCLIL